MKVAMNPTISNVTQTPVLCKDGTTQIQLSSPNAKYMDTCMNNGGRAENQTNVGIAIPIGQAPTKNRDSISKSLFKKIAGAYNQNLIIAGLLVAGYFAYKKFKK
jgi:hypothetical protein